MFVCVCVCGGGGWVYVTVCAYAYRFPHLSLWTISNGFKHEQNLSGDISIGNKRASTHLNKTKGQMKGTRGIYSFHKTISMMHLLKLRVKLLERFLLGTIVPHSI